MEQLKDHVLKKLDEHCQNCHFVWQLEETLKTKDLDKLERKFLTDIKYGPEETISAYTLLAYLYCQQNNFDKTMEYAEKAYEHATDHEENVDNGSKYVTYSVYLHIMSRREQWKEMEELFEEMEQKHLLPDNLDDTDKYHICIIKGYFLKKTFSSMDDAIKAYQEAQRYDDTNPEAYFQEAIMHNRSRMDYESESVSWPSDREIECLEKCISMWESDESTSRCIPHPMLLLLTAKLDRAICIADECSNRQKEANFEIVRQRLDDICDFYRKLINEPRNPNRIYHLLFKVFAQISQLTIPEVHKRRYQMTHEEIITYAADRFHDNYTIQHDAGKFFFYTQSAQNFEKSKMYLNRCLEQPGGNHAADCVLFYMIEDAEGSKAKAAEIIKKYEAVSDKEKAQIYSKLGKGLRRLKEYHAAKAYEQEAKRLRKVDTSSMQDRFQALSIASPTKKLVYDRKQ